MTVARPRRLEIALRDQIDDALLNLTLQPQRTALALLGIMIGAACVVAMLTIGHMAQREALKIFSAAGADTLALQISALDPNSRPPALDPAILASFVKRRPEIVAVAGLAKGDVFVGPGGVQSHTAVVAVEPMLLSLAGLRLQAGRPFASVENESLVALVGPDLAQKLSAPGAAIQPGSKLRLGNYLFDVIGILALHRATAFDPSDFSGGVIIPLGTGRRILENPALSAAVLRLKPASDVKAISAWLITTLQTSTTVVRVQSARDLIETMKAQNAVHTRLLAAIGAVSLLVGGIGVMNVMLMGVMERKREIGLRVAVGATPRDIQFMFLVEAAVLAFAGGLAGGGLGLFVGYIVAIISHWTFSPAVYSMPIGLSLALFVGISFGLYPAIRASQLTPTKALRAE